MKLQWSTWFSLPKSTMMMLYVPALLLLCGAAIVSIQMNIPIEVFTKDPLSFSGLNPFTGVLSNIGIIFWSFTVAICFLTLIVLSGNQEHKKNTFLFIGGAISLMLLLDDCFMLHETIYPQWFHIPENVVMLSYACMLLGYLYFFRQYILSSDITLLLLFLFMFGISAVVDVFIPEALLSWLFLIEDGAKFIGIISWFGYQTLICAAEIKLCVAK